jgi:NitT/TauT family transport system substrate-binding protein
MKLLVKTAFIFSFLFTFSSFSSAQSLTGNGKPAPSLIAVKLGIPVFGVNYMPFVVAKEKGFYRQEGLDVDFIIMSASAAMAATVSGAIEFNGYPGTTVGAAMQGGPVKLVLSLARKPKYWMFSLPEIHSVAELVGRTIGVSTRGSGAHVYTLFILEKLGLAGKVQVLPMTGFSARSVLNALISRHVHAGYSSDSTYFEMKDRGFREILNYADYIDDPSAGVGTSDRLIATRPNIVQAFVNGSYRGMLFYRKHRDESINIMMRYMKLDERTAARTYDLVVKSFGGNGAIDYEPVRKVLELRKRVLNIAAPVPPAEAVLDNTFAHRIPR